MNKLSTSLILVLLLVVSFALVLLNNQLLSGIRLDLTENKVYSLSQGSKKIVADIDEPINFYFFFSDKATKGMTSLRNYANRVETMLKEYAKSAPGKIKLHLIDPEAFSEAEDQATQFGLSAAGIGGPGDSIYFGLAATNSLDDQKIIAFFDPQKEKFLEYDISKLLFQLSQPETVKVTLISDLPIAGAQNPMSGQQDPAWSFYTQLEQLYDIELLPSSAESLPAETDVLMLVHPGKLSDPMLYDIDQFAMKGGKMLIFVDPANESDPIAMMSGMGANGSNLPSLFASWGLAFDDQNIILDAESGLDIRAADGGVVRHFGFVGLGEPQLDREDVTTANLEIINGASFGHFSKTENSSLRWVSLMKSSANADVISAEDYAAIRDPSVLANGFKSKDSQYVLAARLSGNAKSAYDQSAEESANDGHLTSTQQLNAIVVGDTDMLADRFWVQQSNFFGQTVFTPFANNGDFITNAVENLGGSNALISIRSRGTFARSFTEVDALTVEAERKFREQEQLLQRQLEETEQQLVELQNQQAEGGALVISDEQQRAIDNFLDKKIEIRKGLRDVRHQLDKDIELLGNILKFINIAVAPFILMLIMMLLTRLFRTKSNGTEGVA